MQTNTAIALRVSPITSRTQEDALLERIRGLEQERQALSLLVRACEHAQSKGISVQEALGGQLITERVA